MKVVFFKYQGTGNDFVMLDNFDGRYDTLTVDAVRFICERKMGIGADGLIRLSSSPTADFEVDYFNPDGSKSFCGNGARCSVAFAHRLGRIGNETVFTAIDGTHRASLTEGIVRLEMLPVQGIRKLDKDYLLHTGSPHFIRFAAETDDYDIVEFGRRIRYSEPFREEGVNVNLLVAGEHGLSVRTYERGVEDETLSCGTGVTACALAYLDRENLETGPVLVETLGGMLKVEATRTEDGFRDIWLSGPAQFVFDGSIDITV